MVMMNNDGVENSKKFETMTGEASSSPSTQRQSPSSSTSTKKSQSIVSFLALWYFKFAVLILILYLSFFVAEEFAWRLQPDLIEKVENNNHDAATDSSSPVYISTITSGSEHEEDILKQNEYGGHNVGYESILPSNVSTVTFPYEEPFPMFGSLQYRRVCSTIGLSSVVCMTIRFPWDDGVQLQDENVVGYPKPVDSRFLKKKLGPLILDDGLYKQCWHMVGAKNAGAVVRSDLSRLDDLIKKCLDMIAEQNSNKLITVAFFRIKRKQQNRTSSNTATTKSSKVKHNQNIDDENESSTNIHGDADEGDNPWQHIIRTGPREPGKRVLKFFDGQVVHFFGDSTTPGTLGCIRRMFEPTAACVASPVEQRGWSYYCGGTRTQTRRRLGNASNSTDAENAFPTTNDDDDDSDNSHGDSNHLEFGMDGNDHPMNRSLAWTDMDETRNIYLGMDYYYPVIKERHASHQLPTKNLTEWIKHMGMKRNPGWTELRDLSIIILYPFAHTQTQIMIYNEWDDVVELQTKLPEMIMTVQTEEGKKVLKELGWNLKHVIVFDGYPQYFPTSSSAYFGFRMNTKTSQEFLQQDGYGSVGNTPPWQPDFGSNCRGPVPSTSNLTKIHLLARTSFERLALLKESMTTISTSLQEPKFHYIYNWEFNNQFWWLTAGWGSKGLDCTHGTGGYYCITKYLLQALIDDYHENNKRW